jgi:hypothetical protein
MYTSGQEVEYLTQPKSCDSGPEAFVAASIADPDPFPNVLGSGSYSYEHN